MNQFGMVPYMLLTIAAIGCQNNHDRLEPVSVADFARFISETGYVTDAEQYGWSIIQDDIFNFHIDSNLYWVIPNGLDSAIADYPVTQVSYTDATAYCKWANARLPSYEEYWQLTKHDKREINFDAIEIRPLKDVNIVGNVWDITTTENFFGEIRLAGGSYLCHPNTCNGTSSERELYVDKATGNTHISFSVIPIHD